MNSVSSSFFVLLVILTLWPLQVYAADETNGNDLINKACERALFKDFCKSSLQSSPESKHASLNDLAKISLNLALSQGNAVHNHVKDLLSTTTPEPKLKQCLEDCSNNFEEAVDQLEDSIAALGSKGYSDVNTWVTAAMSDAESCQNGFQDQQIHNSPLTEKSTTFSKLCSNVLAITNQLAGM
uniref:Putative pectinesterase inhibitor-like n=1 Tax=Davidia involucrata TaxID=16924 RepID=A0A5B6YJ25_DAVIN